MNIISKIYQELKFVGIRFRTSILTRLSGEIKWFIRTLNPVYLSRFLRLYGAKVGKDTSFNGSIIIDNMASGNKLFQNLNIGENCFVGVDVFFDLPGKIVIEDEAVISAGVKILTHQDCGDRMMSKYYPRKVGGVIIGQGSWIGVNVVILSGVKLGKGCVVAAGSVVTSSFGDYSMIAGVPAKEVKKILIES